MLLIKTFNEVKDFPKARVTLVPGTMTTWNFLLPKFCSRKTMSIVFNFILLKMLPKNVDLIYLGSSDDDSFAKVFQHEGKS